MAQVRQSSSTRSRTQGSVEAVSLDGLSPTARSAALAAMSLEERRLALAGGDECAEAPELGPVLEVLLLRPPLLGDSCLLPLLLVLTAIVRGLLLPAGAATEGAAAAYPGRCGCTVDPK